MTVHSVCYWLICTAAATLAAEPDMAATLSFAPHRDATAMIQMVPEPSRALFLFAGVMAMAFTYRRAWLNWKRGA